LSVELTDKGNRRAKVTVHTEDVSFSFLPEKVKYAGAYALF